VIRFDLTQLVDQRVVLVVSDLGVVEDVVAVAVVIEDPAQLGRALGGIDGLAQGSVTSSTAESISRARS
jgi:hypothetical protein